MGFAAKKDRVIAETDICWACNNFTVRVWPFQDPVLYGFAADSKAGQALLNFCDSRLPYYRKPEKPGPAKPLGIGDPSIDEETSRKLESQNNVLNVTVTSKVYEPRPPTMPDNILRIDSYAREIAPPGIEVVRLLYSGRGQPKEDTFVGLEIEFITNRDRQILVYDYTKPIEEWIAQTLKNLVRK
jgi:hypothetical protein